VASAVGEGRGAQFAAGGVPEHGMIPVVGYAITLVTDKYPPFSLK
jgi:hypothetical protein